MESCRTRSSDKTPCRNTPLEASLTVTPKRSERAWPQSASCLSLMLNRAPSRATTYLRELPLDGKACSRRISVARAVQSLARATVERPSAVPTRCKRTETGASSVSHQTLRSRRRLSCRYASRAVEHPDLAADSVRCGQPDLPLSRWRM